MRKIVDLKKQSKKAQKAFHATQRGSWNGINPVSRVVPSGKAYSRAKAKAEARKDACRPFFSHFRRSTKSKLCFRPRMKPLPGLFYKENGGTLAFVAPSASCRAWGLRMLHCGTPQESLKRRWLQHFLVEKIYGHKLSELHHKFAHITTTRNQLWE